jgi:hypothetical protein
MAKVNFRQLKRQKEMARKQRQDERLARRSERPDTENGTDGTPAEQTPVSGEPTPTESAS